MTDPSTATTDSAGAARAYYRAHPAPLVTATALVLDERHRLLVLTPTYKDHLELPGGLLEDGEMPEEALARELAEEIDLRVPVGRLLAVDSLPAQRHGRVVIAHIHAVGPLPEARTREISFPDGEIGAARWMTADETTAVLPPVLARRVRAALAAWYAGGVAHLVAGVPQTGSSAAFPPERRSALEAAHALDPSSFVAGRPKVVIGATVLCTHADGRVLLVRPGYRDDGLWRLPGGCVDSDTGETPRTAARRELLEELGWCPPLGRLLAVNWRTNAPYPAGIHYVYDGGTVTEDQVARLTPDPSEIAEAALIDPRSAGARLGPDLRAGLGTVVAAQRDGVAALEFYDGRPAIAG
ncbi:NUDIX domain-containing protein [Streptomyces polyrhachis]|uniref:NUDIX domain-containing protein n=1 Tax=Streptomyces polyrhachis TaxID=1282885 RepID=A0ABW2GCI4_9ACTN